MELWQAIVLGIVEGVTEYLPVSSTGHLILAADLLGLGDSAHEGAMKPFEIVIQAGAILAVVGLYWPRFVQMLKGLLGKDAAGFRLLVNLAIAFLPAAVIGLLIHKWIDAHLMRPGPVVAAMVVGGIYMIGVELWRSGRFSNRGPATRERGIEDLRPGQALLIGVLQCFSMWPGTSRSMMTITGGYFAGLRPAAAAEFSFLLGVPTLLAASGLSLVKDLARAHAEHTPNMFQQLGVERSVIGIAVAAAAAAVAVQWLVGFLNRRGLAPFGVYRIVLGAVLAVLIMKGLVTVEPRHAAEPAGGTPAAAPASR